LGRGVSLAAIGRSETEPFEGGQTIGATGPTERLKTGAIKSGSSQAIGAPSFSPYQSWVSYRTRRPIAHSPRLLAIGYSAASIRRAAALPSFAKYLLQFLNLLAGDELFERFVVHSFDEIDFQDLFEQGR